MQRDFRQVWFELYGRKERSICKIVQAWSELCKRQFLWHTISFEDISAVIAKNNQNGSEADDAVDVLFYSEQERRAHGMFTKLELRTLRLIVAWK